MEKGGRTIMTNEEIIEEILIDAHSYGLRVQVIETAKQILDEDPRKDKVVAYEEAFNEWIK
jgi:hypothetical protein